MKTIIIFLILTTSAIAGPCDEHKKTFNRAKAFNASNFKCTDNYDGSATSSFVISQNDYKNFINSELERNRKRIKRIKNY